MKVGIEVEGRFRGIRTLFLSAEEYLNPQKSAKAEKYFHMAQQIYISDLNNEIKMHRDGRLKRWAKDMIVTIELTRLNAHAPEHINIILRLEANSGSLNQLGLYDQIKIEPNDERVYMTTLAQMVATYPAEYRNDEEIKL